MNEYYFMDGNYVLSQEAVIPVRTHGFLYGTTVFEGIRAYYNKERDKMYAFRVREHYERMLNSCKIMFMDCKYSVDELCDITHELLKKNNYGCDTYIRPTVYKSAQKVGPGLYDNPDSVLIFTTPLGDYIDTAKGLKVCVSSWNRLEDNTIPPRAKISGAYANTALIVTEARMSGFDDAIVMANNGQVTEGSAMNLFLVEGNALVTSPATSNILVGITRNTIIRLADEINLKVIERPINRTELYIADEAFYCGTGAQIAPITSIDHRKVGDGKVGETTSAIQKLYLDIVRGENPQFMSWCMEI